MSNRYAPLSEWYSRPSKREHQQDKRLAGLERKLDALLSGNAALSATRPHKKPAATDFHTAQAGKTVRMCSEKPTVKTVWVCNECACPHDNARKLVCWWCKHKRPDPQLMESSPAAQPCAADARAVGSSGSASCSSAVGPTGPMSKGWAVALLRKHGALSSPAPAGDTPVTSPGGTASATPASPVLPASTASSVDSKRAKLFQIIQSAKDANASSAVIAALQADLDSIPESKVGQLEMDQGRLLQLRAKQQSHHQAQLDALNQELSAVHAQIEILNASAAKLQDSADQLMAEHVSNLAMIDQAIGNLEPQRNAQASHGGMDLDGGACLMPSTAQVLSDTLGKAINDPSLMCNIPLEHQATVKSFCATVTAAFAATQPTSESQANATCALERADAGGSMDMNPHNVVGHLS